MSVKISVYTCLCGEKRKMSVFFEDIWLLLNVHGLFVVFQRFISAAEVFLCNFRHSDDNHLLGM